MSITFTLAHISIMVLSSKEQGHKKHNQSYTYRDNLTKRSLLYSVRKMKEGSRVMKRQMTATLYLIQVMMKRWKVMNYRKRKRRTDWTRTRIRKGDRGCGKKKTWKLMGNYALFETDRTRRRGGRI